MYEYACCCKAGNAILEMAHHPIFYDDRLSLFHELGGVCASEVGTIYPAL